jgi:putative addiction module killer protein
VIELLKTAEFEEAFGSIRDAVAKQKILIRLKRLQLGNPGDVKGVGEGVSEIRIDHGPGYRVYYTKRGAKLVLILLCGDKSTQDKDIAKARILKDAYE